MSLLRFAAVLCAYYFCVCDVIFAFFSYCCIVVLLSTNDIGKPNDNIFVVQTGKLHQGRIRMARGGFSEAFVGADSMPQDILIQGLDNLNRAVDGGIYH